MVLAWLQMDYVSGSDAPDLWLSRLSSKHGKGNGKAAWSVFHQEKGATVRNYYQSSLININTGHTGLPKKQAQDLADVKEMAGKVAKYINTFQEKINKVQKVAEKVLAPIALAVPVIALVHDQVAKVSNAKEAQIRAVAEAEQWTQIVKQVEFLAIRASKQAAEDARLQLARAKDLHDMNDPESIASSLNILEKEDQLLTDKTTMLEKDQSAYLIEPLDQVKGCALEIKRTSEAYNGDWAVVQWWNAGHHEAEMAGLHACIQRSMNVLSQGIGVFNGHHILDVKKNVMDVVRGTDAIRKDVRSQAAQTLSVLDQGFEMMSDHADTRHSQSMVQLQELQRAGADRAAALSTKISSQHAEGMTLLTRLYEGGVALQEQVTSVHQSISNQLAENQNQLMQGLGSLAEGQKEMSQQMHKQHETHVHTLSLARQDIANSQLETRENFRRLDPTLALMSSSIAKTEGYLEAMVRIQSEQRASEREMQRDLLMAVSSSDSTKNLLALLDRKEMDINHLQQQLEDEKAERLEWQKEFMHLAQATNQSLTEEKMKTKAAIDADPSRWLSRIMMTEMSLLILSGCNLREGFAALRFICSLPSKMAILLLFFVAAFFVKWMIVGIDVLGVTVVALLGASYYLKGALPRWFVNSLNFRPCD